MKRNLHISMFLVLLLLSTFLIVGQAFGYYLEPDAGGSLMETEPTLPPEIISMDLWLYTSYRTWSTSINKDIQGDEYFFSFYLGAHGTYTVYAEIVLNPGGSETILAQTQFTVTSSSLSLFTDTVTGIDPDIPSGGILAVRLKSNAFFPEVAVRFKNGYMPFVEVPNEYLLYGCEGDFEPDGDVDGSDLAVFAADFGRTNCDQGDPCEGDFDGDNDVDGSDLAVFAADFGRTDCP